MKPSLIYIVEDNFFYGNLLESRISNLINCQTKLFSSGQSLLTNLEEKPQFIFLDHHLPDCKGLDLIPAIKQHCASTKIIVLSSQVKLSIARMCYAAGAFHYMVKNHDDTTDSLQQILESYTSTENRIIGTQNLNKHPLLTNYKKSN